MQAAIVAAALPPAPAAAAAPLPKLRKKLSRRADALLREGFGGATGDEAAEEGGARGPMRGACNGLVP